MSKRKQLIDSHVDRCYFDIHDTTKPDFSANNSSMLVAVNERLLRPTVTSLDIQRTHLYYTLDRSRSASSFLDSIKTIQVENARDR